MAYDLKYGPGTSWAGRDRPDPARPHLRELTPPGKILELEMLHFLLFESVSKRDIERDMSAIFVSRKAQCESGGMLQQN